MFTDATCNTLLDTLAGLITEYSLHSAFPGLTGANELAGGAPAYARKAAAWNAAAGRNLDNSNAPTFDVPAGATVAWIGLWGAANTYRGCAPVGGAPLEFTVDVAANTIRAEGHGLANDQKVVFYGGNPPTGLAEGTIYFVVNAAADTFQVAAAQGGAAIDLTGVGDLDVLVSKIVPETYGAQGTFNLTDTDIALFP